MLVSGLVSALPLAPAAFTLVREAYGLRVEKVVHILRDELVVIDVEDGQSGDGVEAAKPERIELGEGLVVLRICSACSAGGLILGERRTSPRPAGLVGQSFRGQLVAEVLCPSAGLSFLALTAKLGIDVMRRTERL